MSCRLFRLYAKFAQYYTYIHILILKYNRYTVATQKRKLSYNDYIVRQLAHRKFSSFNFLTSF